MGKKIIEPWDGKSHVEGLTRYAEPAAPVAAPEATPPAQEAVPEKAPEVAPVPSPVPGISLDQLQSFAAMLLLKRLREIREEEGKK